MADPELTDAAEVSELFYRLHDALEAIEDNVYQAMQEGRYPTREEILNMAQGVPDGVRRTAGITIGPCGGGTYSPPSK